jgi:hypothetical protein
VSELAYRAGVVLLWVSGISLVVAVVALAVIAWSSRDKNGPWLGD